ncbi:hypothetical protein [Paenibacillus montanisoli]|uniref:Uncharacterized protein n=1 Tax=Paenibacillus montanisoli TaxID=2081970 RepID=A0A328U8I9_9BACL|nr:hypothetical protein [Paenibacillus montanisoli]RAP76424.1 hypothetical protein DL346_13620 [Paenibacillus montanisoli]
MAFSIFFSITVIMNISYAVSKKNLHLFEIMFVWMVVNIIHHNFMTVFALNMGMFDFGKYPSQYWTMALIRVFLIPLLIIWYLDKSLDGGSTYKKWTRLPVGISILVGIEYLANALNVYHFNQWKLWWSFAEWFVIFLLINYPWIWFRKLLRKEMG